VGGFNRLTLTVEPAVRAAVASFELELCQQYRCEQVEFPARSDAQGTSSVEGIGYDRDRYLVDLDALGGRWDPDAEASLDVSGRSMRGADVLSYTESFDFDRDYPNGKRCDPEPFLHHAVRLDAGALDGTAG
jgi:hypothetical protein